MPASKTLLVAVMALAACRTDPLGGRPFSGSNGPDPAAEDPPPSTGGAGARGGAATGGRASGGGTGGTDDGAGGDDAPPSACDAELVTLDEVRAGVVVPNATIALVATATSQKFLVSETEAGSCLWGAFVGDEPDGDEPRGVLVVSYGSEAPGSAPCVPGHDAIPDELAPGDTVHVVARATSFAPASCSRVVPTPELVADARCPLQVRGHGTPPEPVPLPLETASELARQLDADLVRRWAGGLVRLENVSALPNESGDGAVRPYGVVALAETDLEVHADIEYGDLSGGGPRDAAKGLDFPYPQAFRWVTGLVYLDYCDYALAPRRRCEDFDPPSLDCR
jgi:hypothetical protein